MITRFLDGLRNVAANLGTGGDKASYSTYAMPVDTPDAALAAYMTSLMKKAVDITAEDTYCEWRAWQADPAQIEAIEAEETRLGLKMKLLEADKLAQVTGGAAIYMGGLPGDPEMPVNVNALAKGSLKFLTVLPRTKASGGQRVTDPTDPRFGEPEFYNLGTQRVHPSRIIRLTGHDYVDRSLAPDGYGVSVYMAWASALKNLDLSSAATANLITEAKVDVIGFPGLTENFATAEYEAILTRVLGSMVQLKSITNALVIDSGNSDGKGGQSYEQKQVSFAGLPDVMDRFMLLWSAATDIPQTRLYGRSPQGMNATGDGDMKNWAKTVASRQELKVDPAIMFANEVLIRSALGVRPDEIWYEWRPIYSVSEKEGAEIEKLYADGLTARINTGAFADDVLARSELNRMVESGRYPGIEDAISESDNDGVTDPEEAEAREMERMQAEAEIAANGAREPVE